MRRQIYNHYKTIDSLARHNGCITVHGKVSFVTVFLRTLIHVYHGCTLILICVNPFDPFNSCSSTTLPEEKLQIFYAIFEDIKNDIVDPVIQQIAREYKAALQEIYGDELAELILFGSYARGDQHEESDVDFAVVFRDDHLRTVDDKIKISSIGARLSLKYGKMISSLSVSLTKKQTSMQGVYQEIRKQGIAT